jgi:cell division septation protein DedD
MTDLPSFAPDTSTVDLIELLGRSARRRIPFLVIGLVAIVAGFAVLVISLDSARRDAEARRDIAQAEANRLADTLNQAGQAYTTHNMVQLGKLLKVAITQSEQNAQAANAPESATTDPTQQPIAVPTPTLSPSQPARTITIAPTAQPRPQAVFIQFAGLIERSDIVALNSALRAAGWRTQSSSGERTGKAAGLNEVRYSSDEDKAAAEELAEVVTQAGIGSKRVVARQVPTIRPNTLEIWISKT